MTNPDVPEAAGASVPPVPVAPPTPAEPYPSSAAPYPPSGAPYPPSAAPYPPSAAPYPASAAPYPYSAAPYPASAVPYGLAPVPTPRRSPWIIVLSILSGVLFLAAGGLGALYYIDHDKAATAAAEQQTEIHELKADLSDLEDDYADLEEDADACHDAVQAFAVTDPPPGATQEEISRLVGSLILKMVNSCDISL